MLRHPDTVDIYKIECLKTGRVYIGQTIDFEQRILNHYYRLKAGKHNVPLMQEDFDKYGWSAFVASIIAHASPWCITCEDGVARKQSSICEKSMMEQYKSYLPEHGYNYQDVYFHPHGGYRKKEVN